MIKDFYEVLGLPRTSSKAEIKAAFKKLARQYHPDKNKSPEAEAEFKKVSEAYAVLSDGEKRALYNALGPEKYNEPQEVFRYHLEQEASARELKKEHEAYKSAQRDDIANTTGTLLFFLLLLDLAVPSWVLGPWYFIFNGFLLLAIAISVYQWFEV